ncbi:hypothetical protein C8Q76DRAFT_601509, partial [Earliella scabrosa]
MHSGETNQRLGAIPLVLGMPVIVSQNFDVHGGIVNGSIGQLKKVRYRLDRDTGDRYLRSCVISLPGVETAPMKDLTPGDFPIMEDT